jgi:hypothetical protein
MPFNAMAYGITCIVDKRPEKASAKFKNLGATQVVAAQATRDLRGPRIWRAGVGWHFGGAHSAAYRTNVYPFTAVRMEVITTMEAMAISK